VQFGNIKVGIFYCAVAAREAAATVRFEGYEKRGEMEVKDFR